MNQLFADFLSDYATDALTYSRPASAAQQQAALAQWSFEKQRAMENWQRLNINREPGVGFSLFDSCLGIKKLKFWRINEEVAIPEGAELSPLDKLRLKVAKWLGE